MGLSTQYNPGLLELLPLAGHTFQATSSVCLRTAASVQLSLLVLCPVRVWLWDWRSRFCAHSRGSYFQPRFPSWSVVPMVPNFDSTHLCPLSPDPIFPSTSLLSRGGLPKFAIAALVMLLLFSRLVCLTLCDPMDCSAPGFPVLHYLLELAQTHVHWVSDAFQPSHPLPSLSPPALNFRQHQGLLKWVIFSHQVAKVSELQLQHQSFRSIRVGFL